MPTPREIILITQHARLLALPAIALRDEILPERVPAEGLLILRDGEPRVTWSSLASHYQRRAEIEAVVQGEARSAQQMQGSGGAMQGSNDRDTSFDRPFTSIGAAISAGQRLGGTCDWVKAEALRPVDLAVAGAARLN